MPYVRRSRKSRKAYSLVKPVRYSAETFSTSAQIISDTTNSHGQFKIDLIPIVAGNLGTRKVKNFTLRFFCGETEEQTPIPETEPQEWTLVSSQRSCVFFFLVYVPEGTLPHDPNIGTGITAVSCYEPNQNVIMSGIIDNQQIYNFKTRLGRNLQSGDTIGLVLLDATTFTTEGNRVVTPVNFSISYAISF